MRETGWSLSVAGDKRLRRVDPSKICYFTKQFVMITWLITVESCVVFGPLITLSALGPVDMVQFLEDHETARQYRGKSARQ